MQSWVFGCVQRMLFLQPRISQHEYYPHLQRMIEDGSKAKQYLVRLYHMPWPCSAAGALLMQGMVKAILLQS